MVCLTEAKGGNLRPGTTIGHPRGICRGSNTCGWKVISPDFRKVRGLARHPQETFPNSIPIAPAVSVQQILGDRSRPQFALQGSISSRDLSPRILSVRQAPWHLSNRFLPSPFASVPHCGSCALDSRAITAVHSKLFPEIHQTSPQGPAMPLHHPVKRLPIFSRGPEDEGADIKFAVRA